MYRLLRLALLLATLTGLAACGFHLRGAPGSIGGQLPYGSLYIALDEGSEIRVWLQRYIKAMGGTTLADSPTTAEAVFQQLQDQRQKTILSVNAQGRVREYRLQRIYTFRVVTPQGRVLVPANEITLTRDMTYDDSAVLSKALEEEQLWRDMSGDVVTQALRRITLIKPRQPTADGDD